MGGADATIADSGEGAGGAAPSLSPATKGRSETRTVPYWLLKVSDWPLPCCCEKPEN